MNEQDDAVLATAPTDGNGATAPGGEARNFEWYRPAASP